MPAPTGTAYPASRPGQSVQPSPTRTVPTEARSEPPPPQPGAAPVPSYASVGNSGPPPPQPGASPSSRLPPPPRAGEMPSQSSIPPPQQNMAPTRSTMPMGPVSGRAPRPSSVEHAPGYVQNIYAQQTYDHEPQGQQSKRMSLGDSSLVDTAKGWLGAAGSKLAEFEEGAWRRINGK
ncbi:hypothetical protein K470DRAFT_257592 [Piedraia hortae CBS 480.64]|uniref:Uncharacterized protein n=1 Tax=Piedraia hortae CBS 480.64 TaxID=1314780 RepID=A0A6A7C028_9PEZI|nr:hypothetical protein K470DRAFT_257592 [Piedraia hortae CBS 480.64]